MREEDMEGGAWISEVEIGWRSTTMEVSEMPDTGA